MDPSGDARNFIIDSKLKVKLLTCIRPVFELCALAPMEYAL